MIQQLKSGLLQFLVATGILTSCAKRGQLKWETPADYYALPRWSERVEQFKKIKRPLHTTTLFIGDSITEGFDLAYFLKDSSMVNMGIGGDFTEGILKRLEPVATLQPKKIFLLIGINDVLKRIPKTETTANHTLIVQQIKEQCPASQLFVQSILPINRSYTVMTGQQKIPTSEVLADIHWLNEQLAKLCAQTGCHYVDLFPAFTNRHGELQNGLTYDGLHLDNNGNAVWTTLLTPLLQ
jgi:lysophospholipase L1-like esterase